MRALLLVLLLAGCASNVERSYTKCLALGGDATYIESADLAKVVCRQKR
jgi:hypothetical protein